MPSCQLHTSVESLQQVPPIIVQLIDKYSDVFGELNRAFLGLAGYYRRFVLNFGKIAKPLTDMLKKDSFHWNDDSVAAFQALK
uniref:Reverse transcriptase/retrotransposon-derived protein RNase H-like domain-containing protein n=1 Tax=Cajanus cajan TaxID=3821 RepID=A0A151SYB1_CAJCA|nr:hypothetical protein KK1_015221 [Cajanus cajan]